VNPRIAGLSVFFVALILASPVGPGATQGHERRGAERLIVKNIGPGQDITSHEWGMVRLEVGIEKKGAPESGKKMKLRRSPLRVKVDNREVSCYVVGFSTGYEGKKTYAYRTVAIRLGPKPGPRVITVLYDGLVKNVPVNYSPSGQLDFTDLYEHQAILGKKSVTIHWFGCYLLKESVKVSLNGETIATDMEVPADAPDLLGGRISPGDRLAPGENRVRIEAVDTNGSKRQKELVFHYYPDSRIPLGDEFVLNLGLEETENGPFLDAVVEGGSVLKTGEFGQRPGPERMGGQTIIPAGQTILASFRAVGTGESTIATILKQYAMDEPTEVEKARVAVYAFPTAAGRHEATKVTGLENYMAQDLFTCAIPGAWLKIENPEGDKGVYGVAAYRTSPQDASAASVSVEFYGPESSTGALGAAWYIESLLIGEQQKKSPSLAAWAVKAYEDMQKTFRGVFQKGRAERTIPPAARLTETTVAGRRAKIVERDVSLVRRRALLFTSRTSFMERFVVVPAAAGFYVIGFSTPASEAQKNQDLFAAITKSFKPLK
jgi:hypothetical protein